jgi:phage terminase large subunit-like protein
VIASDLARALDPSRVATDVGLTLDDWQRDLMRSTAPRILLCCARQTGKSTVASLMAISAAITRSGALVLLVSPSQGQSGELFRTLMRYLRALPDTPDIVPRARSGSSLRTAHGLLLCPATNAPCSPCGPR